MAGGGLQALHHVQRAKYALLFQKHFIRIWYIEHVTHLLGPYFHRQVAQRVLYFLKVFQALL